MKATSCKNLQEQQNIHTLPKMRSTQWMSPKQTKYEQQKTDMSHGFPITFEYVKSHVNRSITKQVVHNSQSKSNKVTHNLQDNYNDQHCALYNIDLSNNYKLFPNQVTKSQFQFSDPHILPNSSNSLFYSCQIQSKVNKVPNNLITFFGMAHPPVQIKDWEFQSTQGNYSQNINQRQCLDSQGNSDNIHTIFDKLQLKNQQVQHKNKLWEPHRNQKLTLDQCPETNPEELNTESNPSSGVKPMQSKKVKKFMSSIQIEALHEHSLYGKRNFLNKKLSLNVSPQCSTRKYKEILTPNFLSKKKKNQNSNEPLKVLTEGTWVNLNVVSEGQKRAEFYIMKKLAQNNSTTTYLVQQKYTGFIYCLKKCLIQEKKGQLQFLIREGKIGAKLDHPLLLKTYCTLMDRQNIYQLMEYMQGGTLFQKDYEQRCNIIRNRTLKQKCHLSRRNSRIQPQHENKINSIRFILTSVLECAAFMHKEKIIHRDIKPSNIFISNDYTLKLGDFGSCGFENTKQYVGTLDYVAPEILLKKNYNQKVDMWSIGCLAYELCCGQAPFYNKQRKITIQNIIEGNFKKQKIHDILLLSLIIHLLQKDINKRISAEEALKHPFIQQDKRRIQ